jgi:glycosyltransferase involved in cell wall biosynthesis
MKILIITDNLPSQINGVVTTFKNVEKYALEDGYEFEYINPSMFKYIDAPGYPEVKLTWPFRLGRKILDSKADHIHIATEGPLGFFARCWLDRKGWKYNTSYHTKFPEFLKKIYGIPERITYGYVRWFHKHSGRVLTTTRTMVDDLKKHGFKGDIIPWTRGVDRNMFSNNLRTRVPSDWQILLSVGRVSKEKNLDAFCELEIDKAIKVVVGDGPYLETLKKRYPNVLFMGKKTGTELAEHFSNADVFVFTSLVDTFGIVIIESLSVGTPVAAYPVPGPIDIIEQGVNGYMNENLKEAVLNCLKLNRTTVEMTSKKWTWQSCWDIFKENLIEKK